MSFFNLTEPALRRKQTALDVQDRVGLFQIQVQWGERTFSRFYTRIDQVFVIWGLITAAIFGTAQFCLLSWTTQALLWTGLTLLGVVGMAWLAWFWVTVERLRWVIYCWTALMAVGIAYTDMGIFGHCWQLLPYLCPVWLGLSAVGYLVTGWGMRSRTFLLTGAMHLGSIPLLAHSSTWQFLATGLVMAGSLLFLSEMQWDMRPPIAFAHLTVEQQAFNREQQRLRQLRGGGGVRYEV